MEADVESSLPEEAAGKLEQNNVVDSPKNGPWRTQPDNMWTFQNYDDLQEYGKDVASADPVVVLVLDNEEAELVAYPKNKHYWVIYPLVYREDLQEEFTQLYIRHSVEYFSILIEEGSATMEDFKTESNLDFLGAGRKKVGTYQGFPIYIRDPAINDSRPESQTGSTTGATTGNTVVTKTTVKPGAAGVVTESETLPAGAFTDAFGDYTGSADLTAAADRIREFQAEYANASDARKATLQALGLPPITSTGEEITSLPPCIPSNPPASAGVSGGRGNGAAEVARRQADAGVLGGRGNGAAEVARRRADAGATAPTTVTQPASTPSSSSTPSIQPPNVYIYEPLTPGFDRYDFNTGRKVYTPNSGPSRNVSGTTVIPASIPRVTTPLDGGIPAGTTTVASGSRLRQRKEAEAAGRQTGPQ